MQIGGGRSIRRRPRDFRPRTDLSEQQLLVLIIEIHSNYICQISNGRERHVGVVRIQINGANLGSRGEYQVLLDVIAVGTVRRKFAYRAIACKRFGIVLWKSKAQLRAAAVVRYNLKTKIRKLSSLTVSLKIIVNFYFSLISSDEKLLPVSKDLWDPAVGCFDRK